MTEFLHPVEVEVPGDVYDRDAIKKNIALLTVAVKALGLRVGINLCTVHIKAMYELMNISCPGFMAMQFISHDFTEPHIDILSAHFLTEDLCQTSRVGS